MTLALYGKSRRRQGSLLLAALVAVLLAVAAGVASMQTALAHHPDIRVTQVCGESKVTVHFDYVGPGERTYTIETRPNSSAAWTQVTQFQASGNVQDIYPAIEVNLPSTVQYRVTISGGAQDSVNLANFQVIDCPEIVISEGQCATSGPAGFTYHFLAPQGTENGLGGGQLTVTFKYDNGPAEPAIQKAETSDSNGHPDWHVFIPFNGHGSITILSATSAGGGAWDGNGEETVSSTKCVSSVPKLKVVKRVVDHNGADIMDAKDFNFTIDRSSENENGVSPTAFVLDDDSDSTRSNEQVITLPAVSGSDDTYVITETNSGDSGWSLESVTCSGQVGDQGNPSGPGNVSVKVNNNSDVTCTFTNKKAAPPARTLKVCKIVEPNFDGTIDGGQFTITVSGQTSFTPNVDELDISGECTDYQVPDGTQVTLTETGFPNPWANASGYPKIEVIPGNDPGSASAVTVTVGDNTCGLGSEFYIGSYDCKVVFKNKRGSDPVVVNPSVRKEAVNPAIVSGYAYWNIIIDQPSSNAAAINGLIINDAKDIEVVSTTPAGNTCTETSTPGQISCNIGTGDVTISVRRPVNAQNLESGTMCEGRIANWITSAAMPSGTVLTVTAGNADSKVAYSVSDPTACTRSVTVCKVVVGNGAGVQHAAFAYGFDIRPSGSANISGSNSVAEPAAAGAESEQVCQTKTVPADKAFDVVEWMSRPAGWLDAAGYPKYSINGGAQVSNNTTTQIAAGSSSVTVTFYNKEASLTVSKVKGAAEPPTWTINIQSTAATTVDVYIEDPGATYVSATGGTCTETDFNDGDGINCTVNANDTLVITVTKPMPEATCKGTDVSNSVDVWLGRAADGQADFPANGGTHEAVGQEDEECTRTITITKYYVNTGSYQPTADDLPSFTLNPPVANVPGSACTTEDNGSYVVLTCTVPAEWNGTVTETPAPGWRECTERDTPALLAQVENFVRSIAQVVKLQSEFTFCNEPYGTIRIEKVDGLNGAAGPLWDFTVGGNFAAPDGAPYTNPAKADQGTPFVSLPIGLSDTPVTVQEVLARSQTQCTTQGGYYTIATPPADTVIDTPGEVQTWTFQNVPCGTLGTGGLIIEKYEDINGNGVVDAGDDPVAAWSFTTTGGGIPAPNQLRQTDASGKITEYVAGFDAGTVLTVTETPQANWTLTRVYLDGAPIGTNLSNGVVIIGGEVRTIRYLNQPKGSINIHKQAEIRHNGNDSPAPNDDDGWTFTLVSNSCGINFVGQTDSNGNLSFSGLPLCSDYVVTEVGPNAASPGFVLVSPAGGSFTNQTPNGQTLTFLNRRTTSDPPCQDCRQPTVTPSPTPTSTPVTPTATPTTPAASPTTPTSGGSPTITVIAGEKTPGPGQPTPIAPSTGGGLMGGTASGLNIILVLAGLLAVTGGLGFLALGRKRR